MKVRCPVNGLDDKSYQEWLVRLPVKLYGWGLRSLKETCGPAYLGALETTIPYMAARGNICPQLEHTWRGSDCWGGGAASQTRWRVVLSSGSQEGVEITRAWNRLKSQAEEAADILGGGIEEVFAPGVEGVGDGLVTGETRKRIVDAMEKTKSLLLSSSLEGHNQEVQGIVLLGSRETKFCVPGY